MNRRRLWLAVGLVSAVAITALQQAAVAAAERSLRQTLSGLSVGALHVDPLAGHIELRDIDGKIGDLTWRAQRVTIAVPLLSSIYSAQAFAAEGKASVDGLEFDLGPDKLRLAHVEASGTTLDSAGLAAILDPKSPLSPEERIDRLTAAKIEAQDVSLLDRDKVSETTISYRAIVLSGADHGRIADLAATGGALSIVRTAPGPTQTGSFGDLQAQNIDLALLLRCITKARTERDAPVANVVAHATFGGLTIDTGDFSVSLGGFEARDLRARPLAASSRSFSFSQGTLQEAQRSQDLSEFVRDAFGSFAIGEITLRDLHVRAKVAKGDGAFDLGRMRFAGIARGKFEEVSLDGFKFDSEGKKGSWSTYAVRGLDLGSALDALFRLGSINARRSAGDAKPADVGEMTSALVDFYQGISLRSGEIRDFALDTNEGGQRQSIRLARYGVTDFAQSRLGDFSMRDLSIDSGDGHVRLGEFSLHGLDFKGVIEALAQTGKGHSSGADFDAWHDHFPTLDRFVVAGLDVDVPNDKGAGNADQGKRVKLSLGQFEIEMAQFLRRFPTRLSATMDHVSFSVPANPQMQPIAALGYSSVDFSAHLNLAWQQTAKELVLDSLSLEGQGMGSAVLTAHVSNVPAEVFSGDLAVAEAALFGATLKDTELRLVNAGLFDRALAKDAAGRGASIDVRRDDYIEEASVAVTRALGSSAQAQAISKAITSFLRDPRSLRITLRSNEGLGIADFAAIKSLEALLHRADVTVVADE